MLEMIWGLKTAAILDVWTIAHVLIGVSIGLAMQNRNDNVLKKEVEKYNYSSWHFKIMIILVFAYAWEMLEYYLEIGLAGGAVAYWFQGNELWLNRFIADPLMVVLGYLLATKFPKTVWPARTLLLLWYGIHLFIFPHSMYLQHIF